MEIPSGERLHFAMENHHAINGKIHYFYGHFQLQTVSSPEGKSFADYSYGAFVLHLWWNTPSSENHLDYMGVSENSVALNPMVNDHYYYPY